jgi:hypothetical protein
MEYEYTFKFFKVKSSDIFLNYIKDFLLDMDDWIYNIENKILILRNKDHKNSEILKLLNVKSNILSEIDIFLSNNKIKNFKIEII